jgi:hypothetical protein
MRVEVHSKYDWKVPDKRAWISFAPGTYTVTRQQGDDIVAAGKGVELDKNAKGNKSAP